MDVVKRVHIVPLGYEYDRIVEPIRRQRADLVYLLEHDGGSLTDRGKTSESPVPGPESTASRDHSAPSSSASADTATPPDANGPPATYHDELREELESIVPDVRTWSCDLTDVYAVLGAVTTIASNHAADDVSVNVSGGGTIAAIGATMACMDVSTDAHAFYVEPESYAHDGTSEPSSMGIDEIDRLPTYPIDSPTTDQVAIMGFLRDPASWDGYHDDRTAPPKKKDLIEFGRDRGLSFMADRRSPDERTGEDKGAFRVLDTHVLDPLEADGYVTIESMGRRRVVSLTEQGDNAYRAFKHKLSDLDQ
ncbi:hypothetical protein C482_19716 [Natrialba chahannaoensis JCM 10990]|uniref:Uncharacterized protein n=1 Tax=Natrialba chahannaoensis JCM 10990 TaxID=1227492 RepID=M0A4G6_9EURY|nr:DUF6293 family protein [Natrialba chahannaoensis]ELY93231.1 hypothetical protein C482_19716 [Natrialba chahannaoensis JCM 10990]